MTALARDKKWGTAVLQSQPEIVERFHFTWLHDTLYYSTTYYAARVDDGTVLQQKAGDVHVATLSGEEQRRGTRLKIKSNTV